MDFNSWRCLLLVVFVLLQVGCATEKQTYDDTTLDSSPSSEDNSHGWGASVQAAGH